MRCGRCGTAHATGDAFCGVCGSPLSTVAAAPPPPPPPGAQPVSLRKTPAVGPPGPPEGWPPAPPRRTADRWSVLGLALAALLVVGGAVGVALSRGADGPGDRAVAATPAAGEDVPAGADAPGPEDTVPSAPRAGTTSGADDSTPTDSPEASTSAVPPQPATTPGVVLYDGPAYWTVITDSVSEADGGRAEAARRAAALAARGYPPEPVFLSDTVPSLKAGYWVVSTGRLPSRQAASALSLAVKDAGSPIAYPRCVGTVGPCPPA